MQTRSWPALVALAIAPVTACAQSLKYEKYTLDNGMTVILHEDHSLPVAAVNIWYRVGSKDEPVGRSGFAHLFEHLMFMGTERVPENQFDVIMESGGGSNNATTSYDRTNYFESGPSSLLPTLLWLEADRLEDLGRTMTREKLDLQRDVVRNERRQSYENAPYGQSYLMATQLFFPPGHPYHIPTIGTHADLEAATVNDVKDFFATFYVPSNLTLCVAGDFDPAAIKPLIQDLFGDLPSGAVAPAREVPPVRLDREVRLTTLDKVQLPMVSHWYHTPPIYGEGNAEVDLLTQVLGDGKSSRLYKRLVMDEQLAAEVEVYQDSNLLGSILMLSVYAMPDADLARVEEVIDEELARVAAEGPSSEELERYKASRELAMLGSMQDVLSRADLLNAYEFYFGEPDSFKRDLDRYRNATPEGVRRWASEVLTPDRRLVIRVLPEAPERDEVSRDARPELAASSDWTPPAPEKVTLSNGIDVLVFSKPAVPMVSMTVLFTPQTPLDDASSPGLGTLAADMLDEGAGEYDALAFGEAVTSIGATFDASTGVETAQVSMTVIKRNLAKGADLLADALTRPHMDQEDWDRVKALHLENLRQQDDNPQVVAARVANRLLFGDASPYGRPIAGTQKSVGSLTLEDVKRKAGQVFRPGHATVLVAGDITAAEARELLEPRLGAWSGSEGEELRAWPASASVAGESLRVYVVDRPGAVQTVVRFAMPAPAFSSPERARLSLINTLFGGSFTSRLNQNLREKNGYTYGARSSYALSRETGMFVASSAVRADVTGAAVGEFLKEFEHLRAGSISPEELTKSRATVRNDMVEGFQTLEGIVGAAIRPLAAGASYDVLAEDLRAIDTLSAADLNALARGAAPLERGVLVLVGDKGLITAQLKEKGLPEAVEVDIQGEPVKP